ncbi:hypothetical protein EDD18DRAFT_1338742 [Armillaria luteobubalina]|uniref:Uncharacterized protein n=1 Tax=Armillaria luteobubalina TaxID=153913 RepID=A0AA39P1Q1_9AGAR|nr:hypothetical protein EDD18DRAFT_1338742 [Armillaria luteobubalina]
MKIRAVYIPASHIAEIYTASEQPSRALRSRSLHANKFRHISLPDNNTIIKRLKASGPRSSVKRSCVGDEAFVTKYLVDLISRGHGCAIEQEERWESVKDVERAWKRVGDKVHEAEETGRDDKAELEGNDTHVSSISTRYSLLNLMALHNLSLGSSNRKGNRPSQQLLRHTRLSLEVQTNGIVWRRREIIWETALERQKGLGQQESTLLDLGAFKQDTNVTMMEFREKDFTKRHGILDKRHGIINYSPSDDEVREMEGEGEGEDEEGIDMGRVEVDDMGSTFSAQASPEM